MRLISLTLMSLDIPFKVSFSHASATRDKTQTSWVIAHSETAIGYGESCPRVYVTGEDMATVKKFFERHHDDVIETVHDIASLRHWVELHEVEVDKDPAAWCAIELALLDCLGKESNSSVEDILGLSALQGEYVYTAVLGDSSFEAYTKQVSQYAALGFDDYKIKVTNDMAINEKKIKSLKASVPNARVRLDANNLWSASLVAIEHLSSLSNSIFAIEEPIVAGDISGMLSIAEALGIKIILDESFINKSIFKRLVDSPHIWIINLRVSKMGGLIRALECAKLAKQYGIACIVGAQVGETSMLTRAGLTLAEACKPNLLAQEGAFGLHLLEKDVCDKPLMFGKQGKLLIDERIESDLSGFGLTINMKRLQDNIQNYE